MKRNILKKLAGVAAAVAMSVMLIPGGSMATLASENTEILNPEQIGSISVTLNKQSTGEVVTGGKLALYKVADVKEDNGFVYTYTDVFKEAGAAPTQDADLNAALASKLAGIAQNSGRSLDAASVEVGSDGKVQFSNLEVGLYLVVQTEKADGNLSVDPFLVTVPVRNANGTLEYNVDASPKVGKIKTPSSTTTTSKSTSTSSSSSSSSSSSTVKRLPQTGQLWWPVIVLSCAGVLLIVTGWASKRRS